jgi:TetR/AcrR family transcriptional regulator, transcriptional repressor for nem operon
MNVSKERLILVATELFLGRGYGVVGTAEICAAAEINKGSFYHFFRSKSDLLVAAIESYVNAANAQFELVANSKATPGNKLRALFNIPFEANRKWRRAHGHSWGCLIGNSALELSTTDESIRIASKAALRKLAVSAEPIVAEYKALHKLTKLDTFAGAEFVIAMMQGGTLMAKVYNDPSRITEMAYGVEDALRAYANKI